MSAFTPKDAVAALAAFDIDGMRPFDTTAADLAATAAQQAYSLLQVLGAGWREAADSYKPDALGSLNPRLHESALDGIARLIALSILADEGRA